MVPLQAALYVLGAMFAFGMMAFFTREANASVLTVATWRAIDVAIVFGIAAFWKKDFEGVFLPKNLKISVPYGLFLGLASSTFVGGYAFTTVANTIFLHNLAPLFTIPLAWWMFSEKSTPNVVAGAFVSLFGVALISGVSLFHVSHFTNSRFLLGDFSALVSAFGYAGVLVWTKITRRENLPILGTLFVSWSIAALVLVVLALFGDALAISAHSFLWVLGLSIFCTNIPFYLLNQGMRHISAGMASLLSMSEVLFATLLGVLVYKETLAPIGWIGGALVCIGLVYPFLQKEKESEERDKLPPLPKEWIKRRHIRSVFWLLILNSAAFLGIYFGSYLLTLIAFVSLLQVGLPSVQELLEYKYPRAQLALFSILTLAILYTLINRNFEVPSIVFVAVPLAVFIVDRYLQSYEEEVDSNFVATQTPKEGNPRILMGLFGLAVLSAYYEHPAQSILVVFSLFLCGVISFETALRNIQHQRKSYVHLPSSRWIWGSGIVLFFVGGIHIVPTGHSALVERLGKPVAQTKSGLLVRLPPPIETIDIYDTHRLRKISVWEQEQTILCGDQSMISVKASIQYHILDLKNNLYSAQEPTRLLKNQAQSLLIEQIRQMPHENILRQRGQLEQTWSKMLQESIPTLGIEIQALQLTHISVPAAVRDSFLDVVSAIEDRSTKVNEAQAYAAASLPKAFGLAAVIHEEAQGDAMEILSAAHEWNTKVQALHQGGKAAPNLLLDWTLHETYSSHPPSNPIVRPDKGDIFINGMIVNTKEPTP